MTKEEKDLLLKDLCERLPYGVKVKINGVMSNPLGCEVIGALVKAEAVYVHLIPTEIPIEEIKLYLRPLSSMTKDEEEDLRQKTGAKFYSFRLWGETSCNIAFPSMDEWGHEESYNETDWIKVINWLNSHHFDYRNLIKKGLALEAPKDMYKL